MDDSDHQPGTPKSITTMAAAARSAAIFFAGMLTIYVVANLMMADGDNRVAHLCAVLAGASVSSALDIANRRMFG